jgi:hypothetical protein
MPQMQLPIFPAGVTQINNRIAVQEEARTVYYIHGHLPVFQHEEKDVRGSRMFTGQMIINGTVRPKEIVRAFGVPMITGKRYVKVLLDQGARGFYEAKPRHSSASVLKEEVLEQAQQLLDDGRSVPEVARELQVLANTRHKAIRAGRLRGSQKKAAAAQNSGKKRWHRRCDQSGNPAARPFVHALLFHHLVAAHVGVLESGGVASAVLRLSHMTMPVMSCTLAMRLRSGTGRSFRSAAAPRRAMLLASRHTAGTAHEAFTVLPSR